MHVSMHPEDAQLAPVAMGGGWKGGRGPKATGPAQGAAGLAGSQAVHYAALLAAAGNAVAAWAAFNQNYITAAEAGLHMEALSELLRPSATQDAQTAAETAQEPEAPDVGQADEPDEIRPPAPLPVDEDGLPLF